MPTTRLEDKRSPRLVFGFSCGAEHRHLRILSPSVLPFDIQIIPCYFKCPRQILYPPGGNTKIFLGSVDGFGTGVIAEADEPI